MTQKIKKEWIGAIVYCIGKDLETLTQDEILSLDEGCRTTIFKEE